MPKRCIYVIIEADLHLMECNLLRNQNIIYFMSHRWPTFNSHWVQKFFKRYQIRVSNALSFHSQPVWFSNSCSVLVFFCLFVWFFSGELFKIDLRSRTHSKSNFVYTCVYTNMFTSLPVESDTDISWALSPSRLGLGYWSRGTQWWSRALLGEQQDEIQWHKIHSFFQPVLRLSVGKWKGA